MKLLLPALLAVFAATSTYAATAPTTVQLLRAHSPKAGVMTVDYNLLYKNGRVSRAIKSSELPVSVTLPEKASGIQVVKLYSKAIPNGQFKLPKPHCRWSKGSLRDPKITFTVITPSQGKKGSISCSD